MLPIKCENEKRPKLDEEAMIKEHSAAPFDLFRDVIYNLQSGKKDLLGDDPKKIGYYKRKCMYIVNRAMSHHADSLPHAIAMSMYSNIPAKTHYMYYINTIRKYKRDFIDWKGDKAAVKVYKEREAKVKIIAEFHGYSKRIAREIVKLYSKQDIENMMKIMEKGDVS